MKVRELKKDVKTLFAHMIGDGLLLSEIKNDEKLNVEIEKMLHEAIDKREDLITRINHPELRSKGTSVKKYYSEIRQEVTDYFNNYYERISKFIEDTNA
jgi:hypothetical protein